MSISCGKLTKKGERCTHKVAYPGAPCAARKFHQDTSTDVLMAMAIQAPPFPETGDISNLQLTGQALSGSTIHDARIDNVDFTLASLDESILSHVRMLNVIAVGASFKEAMIKELDVRNSDFTQSTWSLSQAKELTAADSSWEKAIFHGASIQGSFTRCSFKGAIFIAADLSKCRFYKCDFSDGVMYDNRTLWPANFTPPANHVNSTI